MKGLFTFILLLSIVGFFTNASFGEQYWAKVYGRSSQDEVYSIQQTLDEGYIVVGYTDDFLLDNVDCWVLKLDSNGNIMWQKIYGSVSTDEWGVSIQQTSDEGYIMAGHTYASSPPYDVWIIKLASNGNIVWQKNFERTNSITTLQSIQQTSDGGYIAAGGTQVLGITKLWILKLDSNGDVIWQKTYGGSQLEAASAIQQTVDGGYIVSGVTFSFGTGDNNAWILKLDSNGNIIWQKTYGADNAVDRILIQETSEGKYIAAGSTGSLGAGLTDIWVLKLETNGDVIWHKTYGGNLSETAHSINLTADSGCVVAGSTYSFGEAHEDAWMFKLDSNGAIAWQKTYGGIYGDAAHSIQQTSNQEYIVAGGSWSPPNGADIWVLHLDSNGDILGCNLIGTSTAIVGDYFLVGQNTDGIVESTSFPASSSSFIPQETTVEPSIACCYDVDDYDCDYILNANDNCPNNPNGPLRGTCTLSTQEGNRVNTGQFCTIDANCDPGEFCEIEQADTYPPGGNGIGDACDCEANFNCDLDVDGAELTAFLADFGRGGYSIPCDNSTPCNGDFVCDGDVDGADLTKFLEDFGRGQYDRPCPICNGSPWCSY